MAYLLRPDPPAPRAGNLPPPELAERIRVEDWIDPAEVSRWRREDDNNTIPPTPDRDWLLEELRLVARRRWRDARADWLAAHRVPRREECDLIPLRGCPSVDDLDPYAGQLRPAFYSTPERLRP